MSTSNASSNKSSSFARTLAFVAIAGVCLVTTGIIEWASQPAEIKEYGKVGQEFYPDFTDPTRAKSLEVYAIDTENVRPLEFRVEQLPNGRWVIPSHHNYPADAEDQLATTAASIIGVERDAMVTRWEADHAKFGVVDPKQEAFKAGDVEGVGKRIILRGPDDSVLADYVIGKNAETDGQSNQDQYYVRMPEEDEVYIAQLEIDLSTKFVDWIKTELLDVDAVDARELVVNDYSFDERQGQITNREVSTLRRESSSDPWTMADLNDENMEVNKDAVRETVRTVADLKIIGVRPKQQGLTPDLKLDRDALQSQRDLDRLQSDLMSRGFLLQAGEGGNQEDLRLLARNGELYVAAENGLRYQLHFGGAFAGSQEELEIGFSSDDDEGEGKKEKADEDVGSENKKEPAEKDDGGENANADDGEETADEDADSEEEDSGKPGRYVFVRVGFDKEYLEEPVKPEEPEKPAELKEGEDAKAEKEEPASKKDAEAPRPENNDAGDADEPAEKGVDSGNENGEKSSAEEENPLAKVREEYEEAKETYDEDLKEYESDLEEYNQKVEEGKEKAEKLNRRFADWYYVIPGDSYDELRLSRADLIKEKEEDDEDGAAASEGPGKIDLKAAAKAATPPIKPAPKTAAEIEGQTAADADVAPKQVKTEAPKEEKKPTAKQKPAPKKQPTPKEKPAPKKEAPAAKKPEPPREAGGDDDEAANE